MNVKIVLLALLALMVFNCNSSKNEPTNMGTNTKNQIENTSWTLSILDGHEVHKLDENDTEIHFTLNPETKRIHGYSGCNTFSGIYILEEGNRIRFSKMISTKKACLEAAINESELLRVLEMADNFTISDDQLMLNVGKRAPLAIFKKDGIKNEPITETYWKLKTLGGKDVKMADNQEREIYFMLKNKDNRVKGFAGCNAISGEYKIESGNRIRFSKMATTLKLCPDLDVNEAEFLKIFELADNYTLKNEVLCLNVGRRSPLAVFEAVYF